MEGASISSEVSDNLREIVDAVDKVNTIVEEVATASTEQQTGLSHVSRAISQMGEVTQQTAANAETSSSAATELQAQANEMAELVSSFDLGHGRRIKQTTSSTAHHSGHGTQRRSQSGAAQAERLLPFGSGEPLTDFKLFVRQLGSSLALFS